MRGPTGDSQREKDTRLKDLLSLIVIHFNAPGDSDNLDVLTHYGLPLFVYTEKDNGQLFQSGVRFISHIHGENGWRFLNPSNSISTPWALLLEKDEFLDDKCLEELGAFLGKVTTKPWQVIVERFHSSELLRKYEWFTTQDVFSKPAKAIAEFLTAELRLIPSCMLSEIMIRPETGQETPVSTIVFKRKETDEKVGILPVTVSRNYLPRKSEWVKPVDRDIFFEGHEKYYEKDQNFLEGFGWPLTIYGTVRGEHIPGIIEALKEGLSSPRIVKYVLVYLYRYGLFELADELLAYVPSVWEEEYSIILQLKAMIEFTKGDFTKSRGTCDKGEKLFPEDVSSLENLAKTLLLLDDKEKAKKIFRKIRNLLIERGLEETRPHLNTFTEILESNSGRMAQLSLCMIVRDEEIFLPAALKYIYDVVDEIIIIDTGSVDRTKEVAMSFGNKVKVYNIEWENDFSAARNFAINQASGDYILMLDADETLSAFHILNFHILKALLPLKEPKAFRIPVGKLRIESDWLYVAAPAENFVCESSPIRVFPNLNELRYKGSTCEDIEEALHTKSIDIVHLPPDEICLLHNDQDRERRLKRKMGAYKPKEADRIAVALGAVRDFSFLRMEQETIDWLNVLLDKHGEAPWAWRYGIWLAKLLEAGEPQKSREVLEKLRAASPENKALLIGLASHFIRFDSLPDIALLNFPRLEHDDSLSAMEQPEYRVYSALADFLRGNLLAAVDELDKVLSANPGHLLGQTARFFVLSSTGDLMGSIGAISDILEIIDKPKNAVDASLLELLRMSEEACAVLDARKEFVERSLLLHGVINMEESCEAL